MPYVLRSPGTTTLASSGARQTSPRPALTKLTESDPDDEVPSPTFTLVQTYETPAGARGILDEEACDRAIALWQEFGDLRMDHRGARVQLLQRHHRRLADPRGLRLALDACETYERLGSPEGELAQLGYLPVEYWPAEMTAIQYAVSTTASHGSSPARASTSCDSRNQCNHTVSE